MARDNHAYTPGSDYISFRSETSAEPVKYYYTKSTTIVDPKENGRVVRAPANIAGAYTYVKEGDRMVISKINADQAVSILRRGRQTTTTTTTKAAPNARRRFLKFKTPAERVLRGCFLCWRMALSRPRLLDDTEVVLHHVAVRNFLCQRQALSMIASMFWISVANRALR